MGLRSIRAGRRRDPNGSSYQRHSILTPAQKWAGSFCFIAYRAAVSDIGAERTGRLPASAGRQQSLRGDEKLCLRRNFRSVA